MFILRSIAGRLIYVLLFLRHIRIISFNSSVGEREYADNETKNIESPVADGDCRSCSDKKHQQQGVGRSMKGAEWRYQAQWNNILNEKFRIKTATTCTQTIEEESTDKNNKDNCNNNMAEDESEGLEEQNQDEWTTKIGRKPLRSPLKHETISQVRKINQTTQTILRMGRKRSKVQQTSNGLQKQKVDKATITDINFKTLGGEFDQIYKTIMAGYNHATTNILNCCKIMNNNSTLITKKNSINELPQASNEPSQDQNNLVSYDTDLCDTSANFLQFMSRIKNAEEKIYVGNIKISDIEPNRLPFDTQTQETYTYNIGKENVDISGTISPVAIDIDENEQWKEMSVPEQMTNESEDNWEEVTRHKERAPKKEKEHDVQKVDMPQTNNFGPQSNTYKTALCKNWIESNGTQCKHGQNCFFAHGEAELRKRPFPAGVIQPKDTTKAKTKLCFLWINSEGNCPNGEHCYFAHGLHELKSAEILEQYPEEVQLDRAIVKSLSSKQEETESSVDYGFQSRGSSPSSLGAAQTAQQTKLTPVADLIAQAREALEERMVHTAPFALYKTEICKYFKSNVPGSCVNGEKCTFAHGKSEQQELQLRPYKTVLCSNWNANGDCKYGETCVYAHGESELRKYIPINGPPPKQDKHCIQARQRYKIRPTRGTVTYTCDVMGTRNGKQW